MLNNSEVGNNSLSLHAVSALMDGVSNSTYEDEELMNLSDEEIENLFSSTKTKSRGDRRKIDYRKAIRKKAKINHHGFDYYDNIHQYSKNKIHCSCQLCRGRDWRGRHIETRQEIKSREGSKDYESFSN